MSTKESSDASSHTCPSGILSGSAANGLGRLASVTEAKGDGNSIARSLTYTAVGLPVDITTTINGGASYTVSRGYDSLGRLLTSRTNVGSYSYAGAQPHAVTSISGPGAASYSYNANGKMTTGAGRSYQWHARGKPWKISAGTVSSEFRYGPGGALYRQEIHSGLGDVTTLENIGAGFRIVHNPDGTITFKNRILVAGQAIAVVEVSGTGMLLATKYLHRNGQGSVVAVTDGAGTLLSRSAWGAYFTPWRPLISRHGGHPFHLMAATDFTPCRPPP